MTSILNPRGTFNVKKIAIIGAGPSGLAAAKYLLAENAFEEIDIIEQQAEVGGVWNYTPITSERVAVPQTTPDIPSEKPIWHEGAAAPLFSNPMYECLNTNIPKTLMKFSDQDFPTESLLFPTRQDVQAYLIRYSLELRHHIRFSTQAEDVGLSIQDGQPGWNITTKSTITNEKSSKRYNAVVVANGHYSVPFIPAVPGIEEFNKAYPTIISHSKVYRSPDVYADKKVIVVGNAPSGLDIGTQISKVCRKPLLNSIRESIPLKLSPENKEEVPIIVEYLVDQRGVRFENGRVETDINGIVYCTGYLYSYPFLNHLDPPIVTTGRRAIGLYKQLFNIVYPTLAFTALSQKIIPFPVSEAQAAVIAKAWSNKLQLPEKKEMEEWEQERLQETGDSTNFHVLGYPADAKYINDLHGWAKRAQGGFAKEPPYWGHEECHMREIYSSIRKKFVEMGGKARTLEELAEELGFDIEDVTKKTND